MSGLRHPKEICFECQVIPTVHRCRFCGGVVCGACQLEHVLDCVEVEDAVRDPDLDDFELNLEVEVDDSKAD